MTYLTFSSVSDHSTRYYKLHYDPNELNPIIGTITSTSTFACIISLPFAGYLASIPFTGLQSCVRVSITLIFLSNVCRSIPTLLDEIPDNIISYNIDTISNQSDSKRFWTLLVFLYFSQILNGFGGGFILSIVSKLSSIWFPEKQRGTATGIGLAGASVGYCLISLIAPLIVHGDSNRFKYLLFVMLGMSTILLIVGWIYFPVKPDKLPSVASQNALASGIIANPSDCGENDDINSQILLHGQRSNYDTNETSGLEAGKDKSTIVSRSLGLNEHIKLFFHQLYVLLKQKNSVELVVFLFCMFTIEKKYSIIIDVYIKTLFNHNRCLLYFLVDFKLVYTAGLQQPYKVI